MKKNLLLLVLILSNIHLFCQETDEGLGSKDSLGGLQKDIFLNPLNSSTGYTLKKGEAIYAQAINSLPLPSWAFIGITDRLTAEIDFLPLIGGLLTKPHLPVPSLNFRYKLMDQKSGIPTLAYETMYQYLYNEFDQADNPYFSTWREGSSWYNRINASWKIKNRFHLHFSIGAIYSQHLRLVNKDSLNYQEKVFAGKITPDVLLGLDYRLKRISFHLHTSYGSTFTYLDNVPRKFEVMYGIRLAPFYKNRFGLLKTFRLEWSGFYVAFNDINVSAYVPIFLPYIYWQWTFNNKRDKNK